ncbi:hypothetical protein [Rhizohabitans arisaemae]|nr:hypothetical protein [Rhizohabitans arisaemae]
MEGLNRTGYGSGPVPTILELAEVEKDARVHDARHTAATLLLELGVDIL